MTQTSDNMTAYPRKQWIRGWQAHPKAIINELAEKLTKHVSISYKQVPEAGLAMMQLRDSVKGKPFNLGEIPMSSSWVALKYEDGTEIEGAAFVMADDHPYATSLAILDAILSNQTAGWEEALVLVQSGLDIKNKTDQHRSQMLNRTRVDFALLNQES